MDETQKALAQRFERDMAAIGKVVGDGMIEMCAAALRGAGWTCMPPPSEEIPEPQVGQVWVAPSPRVEPRTVVEVGIVQKGPEAGRPCVRFTSHSNPPHPEWGASRLHPSRWNAWARRTGARPVAQGEG